MSRIRNPGSARIGDKGYRLSIEQIPNKPGGALFLIVAEVADHRLADPVAIEQDFGGARVLSRDQIHRGKNFDCAVADILEITDRRCDDIESARIQCGEGYPPKVKNLRKVGQTSYSPIADVAEIHVDRAVGNFSNHRRTSFELVLSYRLPHLSDEFSSKPKVG